MKVKAKVTGAKSQQCIFPQHKTACQDNFVSPQIENPIANNRGRPQTWARGALVHSRNVVKCFCALVVTAKRPVDK